MESVRTNLLYVAINIGLFASNIYHLGKPNDSKNVIKSFRTNLLHAALYFCWWAFNYNNSGQSKI